MAEIYFKTQEISTCGSLPPIGTKAPDFYVTKTDLSTCALHDFKGQAVLINTYPSIETLICFDSVKTFQDLAIANPSLPILCISMDLPFTLKRLEIGEHLNKVILLSDFRNREFGDLFGLTIKNGALAGLLARSVILLDKDHRVVYDELVSDVSSHPHYEIPFDLLK